MKDPITPVGPERRSLFHRMLGAAGSIFVLVIFAAAMWVLYRELRQYRFGDIVHSMAQLGFAQVALAMMLTSLSYGLLTGYDWLGVRFIGRRLPYRQVALTSFVAYVCGYNFGAILGGSTMRFRLYSTFGLTALEAVKVMAFCTLTFSLGYGTLAGLSFVLDPLPLPEVVTRELSPRMSVTSVFPIGAAMLCGVFLYVVVSAVWHRPLRVRGVQLLIPPPHYTLAQIGIAAADEAVAAGVLYALLPPEIAISFSMFLGIFLLAQISGIVSHVPGGLGVVEAVLLLMLKPHDSPALLASLLVYRLVYYLLPLAVAMVLMAMHEGGQQRGFRAVFSTLFGRRTPLPANEATERE